MKGLILLILFCTVGFSQATSFALYGLGEEIGNTDPASIALGNSKFFTGNSKHISSGSPSSVWKSSLTHFTMHTGMNYLSASSFPKQFQHNLTHFSLRFPIGNKKVISFGLQPSFRTNRLEIEGNYQYSINNNGVDIAYNNYYFVDGGISKLFLIYSWEESSNLSFGIEYSSLFGNQFIDDRLNTYEVEIDTISSGTVISEIVDGDNIYFVHPINGEMINVIKTHKYTGSELILEGRYTTLYHEGVVRLGVNGPIQVQSEDNFNDDSNYLSDAIISELSFGYHYKKSDNSGIIFETHVIPPFNLPHAVALFNIMPPCKNSIHLGTYYQITNPKFGFWNNINLRGGVYLKRLDFSKNEYFDFGVTLGLGLEYIANTQIFDIALRVGERESYILQDQNENYISLHFGIMTGEKWFIKRRRK